MKPKDRARAKLLYICLGMNKEIQTTPITAKTLAKFPYFFVSQALA